MERHSRQDPTREKTRAVAAAETLRAAASGPISATVKGSYSCRPMMLGNATCFPCSADRVVPHLRGASPSASLRGFAGSHTASPGARECGHQVEPATASLRCRRRWHKCRSRCEAPHGAIADGFASRDGATIRPRDARSDWPERLVCSRCGSHDLDMVVTGERAETKKPRWGKPGFRKRTNESVGDTRRLGSS